MSDDYEERRQARREEERRYQADVAYEVWRSGGDMDRVDRERVQESFWSGDSKESAASAELHRQRPTEPEMSEQEYYQQQEGQWPAGVEDGK